MKKILIAAAVLATAPAFAQPIVTIQSNPTAAEASAPRPAKPKAPPAGQRFGRLGSWGWAAVLGIGVVVLSPVVHAFWGDVGVLGLGIFGLGFLLGRWTAG